MDMDIHVCKLAGVEFKLSVERSLLTASSPDVPKGPPTAPGQGLLLEAILDIAL